MTLLEKLAPYLPFNLKCEILNYKSDYVGNKYGIIRGYYFLNDKPYFNFKNGRDYAGKSITEFKPILRPLSEIDEFLENEHNCVITKYEGEWIYLLDFDNLTSDDILGAPFSIVQFFLKNHFDIFNMIESGDAIDINTLNK